ncbi:hypothetical protein [Phytomonospora endophytica]|uniref:Membrane protein implicated in regulation of membrane protease activity n=1 Tax=Phytomonospora endophytica TaxID=714109 RepID=A0A841FK24_9ACTN|nr:hypothetical protein [Phytomonospora endophytica]MBB6036516.1 membrane protein implicated in regulation of membrane protease activity [Phytomonospora endophytica]GIG65838.1 hypothetical protein Pen01_21330 [Phytomonospora endophytica]
MSEPSEATPKKRPRVWDAPEQARVSGSSGRRKPPRRNLAGAVFAYALFIGVFGFLWIFPSFSLVFLLTQEPIQITVTDCYNGSGKGNTGGCDGTWTFADGSAGEGRFTDSRQEYESGDIIDGVHIGGRVATGSVPWILDVAIVYPIAVLLTGALAVKVVRDVRREKRGLPPERTPEERAGRPPAFVRALGWGLLAAAYLFFWGFPTFSAFAMVTADPVAITVTDCLNSRGLTTRCHGEWILDGKPGDGSIESWTKGLDDGAVLNGVAIGDRVVHVPAAWILDLVIFYPLAALLTYVHLRVIRKARLDQERRESAAAEPGTISSCEPSRSPE